MEVPNTSVVVLESETNIRGKNTIIRICVAESETAAHRVMGMSRYEKSDVCVLLSPDYCSASSGSQNQLPQSASLCW